MHAMKPTLYGLSYSPWTEKARWPLDHHRIDYRYREHLPMLGEPIIRLAAGRPFGKVSVPLLVAGARRVGDSFDIATWADQNGTGETLFPERQLPEIRRWNARSNDALTGGRALVIAAVLADEDAQLESVPLALRQPEALAKASARAASHFLRRRYESGHRGDEAHREAIHSALADWRERLDGSDFAFEYLTFADISMAAVLGMVVPMDWQGLGPAALRAWTRTDLAEEFADLVEWRDALFAKHRPPRR